MPSVALCFSDHIVKHCVTWYTHRVFVTELEQFNETAVGNHLHFYGSWIILYITEIIHYADSKYIFITFTGLSSITCLLIFYCFFDSEYH